MVGALYALSPFEESAFDSIEMLNKNIASELKSYFSCAATRELEPFDKIANLEMAKTEDGRINNFNWYTNNGGTWQMYNCVYQYFIDETTAKTKFIEGYAGASTFHKLPSSGSQYLGLGYTKTCSTCVGEAAQLFSFESDTLKIEEVIGFEARMGSIINFNYNKEKQTIYFTVVIDDLSEYLLEDYTSHPISSLGLTDEETEMLMIGENAKAVVDSLVWDGGNFVKK